MKDRYDRAKDVAHIFSIIAIPLIVAFFGWTIQKSINEREIARDYVRMAIQVISSEKPTEQASDGLRAWAAEVLNRHSPVPIPDGLAPELAAITSPTVDLGCLWTKEIPVSQQDLLTDLTAREILGHNKARVERCPTSPPSGI